MKTDRIQKSASWLRGREPRWAGCCRGAGAGGGWCWVLVRESPHPQINSAGGQWEGPVLCAPPWLWDAPGQCTVGSLQCQRPQPQLPTAVINPLKQITKGHHRSCCVWREGGTAVSWGWITPHTVQRASVTALPPAQAAPLRAPRGAWSHSALGRDHSSHYWPSLGTWARVKAVRHLWKTMVLPRPVRFIRKILISGPVKSKGWPGHGEKHFPGSQRKDSGVQKPARKPAAAWLCTINLGDWWQ